MTQGNRRASHSAPAYGNRARKPVHRRVREARTRRSFDGVVAAYIRELSTAGDATRR
jgi:hypothetical protein